VVVYSVMGLMALVWWQTLLVWRKDQLSLPFWGVMGLLAAGLACVWAGGPTLRPA